MTDLDLTPIVLSDHPVDSLEAYERAGWERRRPVTQQRGGDPGRVSTREETRGEGGR
jgi:hypothetical protein